MQLQPHLVVAEPLARRARPAEGLLFGCTADELGKLALTQGDDGFTDC